MRSPVHRALASVTHLVTVVADHISGADIVRREQQARAEAHQLVVERIAALRAGFSAIRERHDELSGRISEQRRQRA